MVTNVPGAKADRVIPSKENTQNKIIVSIVHHEVAGLGTTMGNNKTCHPKVSVICSSKVIIDFVSHGVT